MSRRHPGAAPTSWLAKLKRWLARRETKQFHRERWPADQWEMWKLAYDDGIKDRWVDVPDWMGREMQDIYEDGWREGRSPW